MTWMLLYKSYNNIMATNADSTLYGKPRMGYKEWCDLILKVCLVKLLHFAHISAVRLSLYWSVFLQARRCCPAPPITYMLIVHQSH